MNGPLDAMKLTTLTQEEWNTLDRKVLAIICLTSTKSVAYNVAKEKTTKEMMVVLSSMYEKPSVNNKVHLMKKLFNLKMSESTHVPNHLNHRNTRAKVLEAKVLEAQG